MISTHTSRVGCDKILEDAGVEVTFLLTHPVWDVTFNPVVTASYCIFLLTHPVWDVTRTILGIVRPIRNFYSHIPCGM